MTDMDLHEADRDSLIARLRSIVEWVSERDHTRAIELDEVVHGLEAEAVARQARLKGMSVEDGAALLELESPRELMIAWVWAAKQMLGDAPNYSETRVDFPTAAASMEVKAAGEFERYVLTVQRAGRVTPHEARRAAESEAESLRAELGAVRDRARSVQDDPGGTDPTYEEGRRDAARYILGES